jgi:uncharacterized protein YegP (UPF0339 family)
MDEQAFEPRDTVEIFADNLGEYRWRRKAAGNHEIIATSGEGYGSREHCREMASRVNGNSVHYVEVLDRGTVF